MRYLISEVNEPLTYASSGMLIHSDQFLHPRRCIDTYLPESPGYDQALPLSD